MQQPSPGTPPLQRHLERLDRQMPIGHGADGPADDEARVQVDVLIVIAGLALSEYSPLIARTTPSAPCLN
jgi:hypothetical protein